MTPDLEARQAALDPSRSCIVQAPAGSGKTGLLVYRMLTLLGQVEMPQQVLSITFTRKATAEMRSRLIELLRWAELGRTSADAFEQQGLDLAARVLQQDQRHAWGLLNSPHQLQIQTIDAFSAKLSASMPWLSRLGDRPRTTDQADAHYAAAIEQLLAELLDESSPVLDSLVSVMTELDFNYNKARQLFSVMLAKRDQWLRHLLPNDVGDLRTELQRAWRGVVENHLNTLESLITATALEEICELGINAAEKLQAESSDGSVLSGFLNSQASQGMRLAQWQAVANLLLTKNGFRKRIDKRLGFEAKTTSKQRMQAVLADLAEDSELLSALIEVRSLPEPEYQDADWKQLVALNQVLTSLAGYLQLRFRAVGECDHSEVTQRANFALQELDNPTDLGLRMDAHLEHILVDEFQDTSHGQIELLKRLTAGWTVNDGKTLFLVGDPMQSIYRFREADVSLFLQVTGNATTGVFDNIDIEPLRLTENFRSSKGLVEWFNATFDASFPSQNDVLSGAIRYASATSSKSAGALENQYYLAHNKKQEAELVVTAVKRAITALPNEKDKVAILVRSRTHLESLLPELNAAGIEFAGVDIQPLRELQAVIDVLALCKALCRADDRVAWLSLLRGPWCGLTLFEMKQLLGRQDLTVWQQLLHAMENSATMDCVAAESQQRLFRFVAVMDGALTQCQQVSLGSLTRWAWLHLGGPETLFGASNDDVETVFDLIDSLQRGGDLPSLSELENGLNGLFAKSNHHAAKVVVSTMHKAKGLQYHTVILPGLNSKPRADSKDVLMWAETQNQQGNSALLLAPLLANQCEGSHYDYLRQLEARRAENETIRLMYVACTRAESKLVLIASTGLDPDSGKLRPPFKNTLLACVWQTLEADFYLSEDCSEQELESGQPAQTLSRLPGTYKPSFRPSVDWKVVQQLNTQAHDQEQSVVYEWATKVATGVGIVLHDWLQFQGHDVLSAQVDQPLVKRWRSELLALGVPENRLDYAIKRLRNAIGNIQQDQSAHFLFRAYAETQNEFSLAAFEQGVVNRYRIDRTFVDEQGVRWIVDYKSTDTNRSDVSAFADEQLDLRHRKQLEKYGQLMSHIDTRPIKLAVYFPLLKQLRSWDFKAVNEIDV